MAQERKHDPGDKFYKLKVLKKKKSSASSGSIFWKEVGNLSFYVNADGSIRGSLYLHMFDGDFLVKEADSERRG